MSETKRRSGKRGHGEGTIGQRPDGRWIAQVMVGYKLDGKKDVRTVYGKTRGEVQEKLDDLRERDRGGLLADADKANDTVAAYLTRWVTTTETTVRPKTHERYAELVRVHLVPGLGRRKLAALKPDHVQAFYAAKLTTPRPSTGAPLSPRTVHHCHRVLHRALEMAVRWGYLPRNVCDAVDPPQVPRREMVPPSPADVGRLLDAAEADGDRYAALWALAALTGARQGELLALTWPDVDLDAATLRIRRSLTETKGGVPQFGEPKTAKSRRTVALSPEAVVGLRAHRARQNEERLRLGEGYAGYGLVFASRIGTPLDQKTVTYAFKRALNRVGLLRTVRFHDLRHGAITMMLSAGEPVAAVSEMVGHHSPAMTYGVYGHVIPGSGLQAAERLAGMLQAARDAAASG